MLKTLQFILENIVDYPEKISIDEKQEDEYTIFLIQADKNDIGKIIGRNGKIIRAIRNIMKIPSTKESKRIKIEIS
jgi:hypothetical protein